MPHSQTNNECNMIQVEIDLKAANKIVDAGDITREDFTKFAQDTKLIDFHVAEGVSLQKQNPTKWQPTASKMDPDKTHPNVKPSGGNLLCCYSTASEVMSPRAQIYQVQVMYQAKSL